MSEAIGDRAQSPFLALRQMARRATRAAEEYCDLCGEPIGHEHRHLLQLVGREVLCACRACTLLFDQSAASGGARRLIPTRCLHLTDFVLPDAAWDSLHIPVDMAFFCANTPAQRVMALYPGPMGATESLLSLETWEELERLNPSLHQMVPDVEALLVNRVRQARDYFLVPIDECYKLVGLIRLNWRGLTGGQEVWQELERFFAGLKQRAALVGGAHA